MAESPMYISLDDANTYFCERLHSDIWTAAEEDNRIKAIKMATRSIDQLNFKGSKTDSEQLTEFPRDGDTTIPQNVLNACCEIAFALIDGVDIEKELAASRNISEAFGPSKATVDSTITNAHLVAGIPSRVAWMYLQPYLRDAGSLKLRRVS